MIYEELEVKLMARLPKVDGDDGTWGAILNDYLEVSLSSEGTLNSDVVSDSQVSPSAAINPTKIAGTAETQANKNKPNGYAGLDGSGLIPSGLLPASAASLASDSDVVITTPLNNQVLTYDSGSSKWTNQIAPSAPVSSVFGRSGIITAQSGDYTAVQVGALPSSDDLSAIATSNLTSSDVSLNSHKITNLSNGTLATDAAAFGQIPVAGTTSGTFASGNDSRITGSLQSSNNLSDVAVAATARTNLGLGTAATSNTSAFLASSSTASGDVSGTLGASLTVDALRGNALSSNSPTAAQVLAWNSQTSSWSPTTQYFNVIDYGADQTGGSDSTTAIQNAINAAQASGGAVYAPPGTYLISSTLGPNSAGTLWFFGAGPEHTILNASASFTGTWVMDFTFTTSAPNVTFEGFEINMTSNKPMNGLRIGNSQSGDQADRSRIINIKTRYGATALELDSGTSNFTVRDFYPMNPSVSGLHITNSHSLGIPNGSVSDMLCTNTDSAVVTTQGVLIDCFCSGIALDNVRVIGTASNVYNNGIVYNSASSPSGTNGAFIQATNCITDAITGPGLSLTNCRQFQSTNNFWSALLNTANYGVNINGGFYFHFINDEISGCGVNYSNAPNDISFTACAFPSTGNTAGIHSMPGSNPPTNIRIDRASLYSANTGGNYQLTNNLGTFYATLTDPEAIGFVRERYTNGPVAENYFFDRINTSNTALTSGDIYAMRIWLPAGFPVNDLYWSTGATAFIAGTTTHYWMSLYAASGGIGSGAPLVQSTDNTSPTIGATTLQAVPMSSQYVIPTTGYYYIALFLSSTGGSPTMPTAANYGGISALTNTAPKICYIAETGYSSGTAPTSPGSSSSIGNVFWCGAG